MSIAIRVLLIVVSLFTFIYMLRKIRKSQLQIEHALFWIVFCGLLLILSIFPGIAIWISEVLGLQSPVNLVFLIIIFVLMMELFRLNVYISKLESRVRKIVQHEALRDYKSNEK